MTPEQIALELRENALNSLKNNNYKQAQSYFCQAAQSWPHLLPQIMLDLEHLINKNPGHIGLRLLTAGFYLYLNQLDSAMIELQETIEEKPDCVEAYNLLGKIYIQQDKVDETIELLEFSLAQGVQDVSLSEILAGAYLEKGRISEAITFYNKVRISRPNDKNILRMLGDLYYRIEDFNHAAECYRDMFSDDPQVSTEVIQRLEKLLKKREGSIFIREILATIYMKSLRPAEAIQKIREIIGLDSVKADDAVAQLKNIIKNYPEHADANQTLAEIYCMQNNFTEAVEIYRALAKIDPASAIQGYLSVLELCPQQILARNYLAEAYFLTGKVELALEQFQQMLIFEPETAELISSKCREILRKNPQQTLAHLVLGKAYLVKGDTQRALLEAEGMLSFDKKNASAYLLMGEVYAVMKMTNKAAELLKKALSLEPFNPVIQEKYREIKEKELDAEKDKLKSKLSEDQWKVSLHVELAKLYIQSKEEEEAIRELQLVMKDSSKTAFALNLLGTIYRGQGRFDLAEAQFSRALETGGAEVADFKRTVKFNLATAFEAQGNVRKALSIYEAILQENIDFENLKKRIKYLKNAGLASLRNPLLELVIRKFGKDELLAVWGREAKQKKKEEVGLSFGQSHNNSGYELFMKGMYKAAQEEFQLALQLDSKFDSAINNWAVVLAKEGRLSEARTCLEEAVTINPSSAVLSNNLGVVYLLLGKLEAAKQELERSFEIDPDASAIAVNLGDIYYIKGRIEQADKLYSSLGKNDLLGEVIQDRLRFKTAE